jgi:hypothetical protein
VSSLKINLAKSELVPLSVVEDVEGLACILGCRISSLPMKYLGLLFGLLSRKNQFGMVLLRRNNVWLVGNDFICLRVVESL